MTILNNFQFNTDNGFFKSKYGFAAFATLANKTFFCLLLNKTDDSAFSEAIISEKTKMPTSENELAGILNKSDNVFLLIDKKGSVHEATSDPLIIKQKLNR